MKRFISLLLAFVMVLATLTGCGSSETKKDNSNDTDKVEVNTEIKGTVTVGINSYRNSDAEAVIEAFKKQYPNVEVNPVVFESTTDDATEWLTSMKMANKTIPDVIFDDAGPLPTYIQNGWVYPLTSFVEGDAE